MFKDEIINHWQGLKENQKIDISMVAYKHTGSTYNEDGIRITGSKQFIDSVLSHLKDLLAYENSNTRLQLVYKQSQDKNTGCPMDSYNCYIQVHERGIEAQMCNAFIDGIKQRNFSKYNKMATNLIQNTMWK